MQSFPRIGIVIVHLNAYDDTSVCLRSLEAMTYPNASIIVVDNGSTDGSGERLRQEFPGLIHLHSGENLGCTGGNNIGIEYAITSGCDHVLMLNNDTVITPGFVEPLVERMLSDETIGAVSGKIYYYPPAVSGRDKIIWYAGSFQKWHTGFHHIGESEEDHGQFDLAMRTEYASGSLMLMRGEVIRMIGGLSNEYFIYWEESDWCLHARELGYSSWYEPRSAIYHNFKSAVAGKESPFYMYMQTRNSFIFARRRFHGLLFIRHFFLYPFYIGYRWLVVKRAGNTVAAKAVIRGIIDYFRGYRGKKGLREYGYIRS
ncbi:MAG TPA: glycosyltransferase family 2 protein [Candidatus Kapabacteria bacterium]|nr:glycosyltransferase family 2 protein [Candidatus Kapabacteria bacterium]